MNGYALTDLSEGVWELLEDVVPNLTVRRAGNFTLHGYSVETEITLQ